MDLYKQALADPSPVYAETSSAACRSSGFPSQVSIDLDAVAANVRSIKALVGDTVSLMAVVKANAYGHGAPQVARVAMENGADLLAVACLEEALELRRAGIGAPILTLSFVPADAVASAIALDLTVAIFDLEQARRYQSAASGIGGALSAHLKIDTGMGRLGVLPGDALALCQQVAELPAISLEGIYTHFSSADASSRFTAEQLSRFCDSLAQLEHQGFRFKHVHAANSAALLTEPASRFNLVRPGLSIYGLNPLGAGQGPAWLKPAMSWKTTIAQVKTLPAGSFVGYGNTYRTRGSETIALLPVGYADGLRRAPRRWREVLARGRRAPVIGRISMEKTAINVSHIPGARAGDEVVLLGKQGDDMISAEEIARWIGSINYEVVTSIAPRLPRDFVCV
ncbi:MAG: alanine racemase [Chloroflexi bacterium]|nr:alanine racemase [Chloroflexota bacterium]